MGAFKKWLADPEGYAKRPNDLVFQLKDVCFSCFFAHRTEDRGLRLTWKQVAVLAKALLKGLKDTKDKTEVYAGD